MLYIYIRINLETIILNDIAIKYDITLDKKKIVLLITLYIFIYCDED